MSLIFAPVLRHGLLTTAANIALFAHISAVTPRLPSYGHSISGTFTKYMMLRHPARFPPLLVRAPVVEPAATKFLLSAEYETPMKGNSCHKLRKRPLSLLRPFLLSLPVFSSRDLWLVRFQKRRLTLTRKTVRADIVSSFPRARAAAQYCSNSEAFGSAA